MNFNEKGFGGSFRTGESLRFRIRHIKVRILPRQPGIARFREYPSLDEKGGQVRAFLIAKRLQRPMVELFGPNIPKSLQPIPRKLPVFWRLALETEE